MRIDDAEQARLEALHDRWGRLVDTMIAEGVDPVEVTESMLTISTASVLKVRGQLALLHALLSIAGPLKQAVMQEHRERRAAH